jgi:hypothetical protein
MSKKVAVQMFANVSIEKHDPVTIKNFYGKNLRKSSFDHN